MEPRAKPKRTRVCAAYTTAQLVEAIAAVNADPARPLQRAALWGLVGARLGITGGAAQIAAARAGVFSTLIQRARGTESCPKCGGSYKERVWAWYSSDGLCPGCLVRRNKAGK
jgi:hypothetical protein